MSELYGGADAGVGLLDVEHGSDRGCYVGDVVGVIVPSMRSVPTEEDERDVGVFWIPQGMCGAFVDMIRRTEILGRGIVFGET